MALDVQALAVSTARHDGALSGLRERVEPLPKAPRPHREGKRSRRPPFTSDTGARARLTSTRCCILNTAYATSFPIPSDRQRARGLVPHELRNAERDLRLQLSRGRASPPQSR